MSIILSIETATSVCSVALHAKGRMLGLQTLMLEKSHSTHLTVMIQQLMDNCKISARELDAVAVSEGPGSYTGLRIGVSTAKGLCYALGIPLIGVNTLEAMAYQMEGVPTEADYFCPMIDARRMEVYCMIVDSGMEVIKDSWAEVVDSDSFERWTSIGKVLFFGNGSGKCRQELTGVNCMFLEGLEPSASTLGTLATKKLDKEQFEDMAYFEPFYLKEYRTTVPKPKIKTANGR